MTNSYTPLPAVLAQWGPESRGGSWREGPRSAGAEPFAEGEGEAPGGEGTCRRMHRIRMGGRAGVRSGMPCFPGQCLVHRGCCRVKTSCQRSLREEMERRAFDLGKQSPGHSHTLRAPSHVH